MVFKIICVLELVLWTKVVSALEGLSDNTHVRRLQCLLQCFIDHLVKHISWVNTSDKHTGV